jgi:hypothetical protein
VMLCLFHLNSMSLSLPRSVSTSSSICLPLFLWHIHKHTDNHNTHTHTHTDNHNTHTHTHTHIHTYTHTLIHSRKHARTDTHKQKNTHTHASKHTPKHHTHNRNTQLTNRYTRIASPSTSHLAALCAHPPHRRERTEQRKHLPVAELRTRGAWLRRRVSTPSERGQPPHHRGRLQGDSACLSESQSVCVRARITPPTH